MIDVFSVADTVQDIVRQKTAYREAVARTGEKGWIREALKLIRTLERQEEIFRPSAEDDGTPGQGSHITSQISWYPCVSFLTHCLNAIMYFIGLEIKQG